VNSRTYISILFGLLLLGSCGVPRQPVDVEETPDFTRNFLGTAIMYPYLSKSCPSDILIKKFNKNQNIFAWDSFFYTEKKVPFDYLTTKPSFKSQIIKQTLVNEKREVIYPKDGKAYYGVVEKGTPLTVCDEIFPEKSLESVALNTIDAIENSYEIFQLATKSLNLPTLEKINLSIYPLHSHSTEQDNEEKVLDVLHYTDNATYQVEADKKIGLNNLIYIFPQSEESLKAKTFSGIPLWKIPLVASHEFGHHVYAQLFKSARVFTKSQDMYITRGTASATPQRKLAAAITALNEGFADLFSAYTLEHRYPGESISYEGVSSFEGDRDIHISKFKNSTQKVMTNNAVKQFTTQNDYLDKQHKKNQAGKNHATNQYEVHGFGAIFAHGLNKLFETATNDVLLKIKILTQFALKLEGQFQAQNFTKRSSKKFINYAIEKAVSVTSEFITLKNLPATEHDEAIKACDEVLSKQFPNYGGDCS
jgi:hypothetical protein